MLFKKKNPEKDQEEDTETKEENSSEKPVETGNPKLDLEITRIKAQIEGFSEIRKTNQERFSRISEQVGELRGMIMDSNKQIGQIEVKASRSVDLVSSIQPEKLMIDVRRAEGKVEGLKANIDSNDSIMKDVMKSLKEMRQQMNFYKGIDQVIKLNEEVKKGLMEIKKVEATTKRHADKIDTLFIEFSKKFSDFQKFDDVVKDLNRGVRKLESDFDKVKVKIETKEDKKEFTKLLDKFNDFEKHTTNLLNLLDRRSKQAKDEMFNDFNKLKTRISKKYDVSIEESQEKKPEKETSVGEISEEEKKNSRIISFLKKADQVKDGEQAQPSPTSEGSGENVEAPKTEENPAQQGEEPTEQVAAQAPAETSTEEAPVEASEETKPVTNQ
ncbi:hypothetical protein GOV05_01550 [Candidatus Woesearchaeota archaeon]|nr:hypothetical protein [Candidatus Woesearchaeota archaeon]